MTAGRTIQQAWESLYVRLIAEGWTVDRYTGQGVTTGEQSVTLTFKRKEPNETH